MTSLTNKRVALIGGAGFIGHHLALALQRSGADVSIIDGLSVNNLLNFAAADALRVNRSLYLTMLRQRLDMLREAQVQVHVQDARDRHELTGLIHTIQPHFVIHLAGVAHAARANREPQITYEHTLATLQNTLTASIGVAERIIYFSSSMVYGHFASPVVDEEMPCHPLGIYGALKYAGEKIVMAHQQVCGLPYTIIRPSALYGERCVSGRVGQVFIESALQGLELRVAGDGNERLDFTYIDDLITGVIRTMECAAACNQIFNITYGQSRSIRELTEVIRREFPEVSVRNESRDALMPVRGTLCIDKARRLLGYEPLFSIERGFERYVAWYRQLMGEPALDIQTTYRARVRA